MRNFLRGYAAASFVLALLQVFDGILLARGPSGCFNYLVSFLETAWLPFSLVAVFFCGRFNVSRWVPVSVLVYIGATWIYGVYYLSTQGFSAGFALEIPRPLALAGATFGAMTAIASLVLLRQLSTATEIVEESAESSVSSPP